MNKIIQGDCLEKLQELPDNSVDSIVTDPPYELGFMGKSWDASGIAYNCALWGQIRRVLKPGGYLLAFGGTRTYHRMAVAIEDAGFEVRDMIEWVYGSGFPKSLNIGKAVDKLQGNEREVIGKTSVCGTFKQEYQVKQGYRPENNSGGYAGERDGANVTKGTSEYEGWGTALKPAHEPICMARKPLSEKTVAENCLKWGTGGINIDESRVDFGDETDSRIGTNTLAGGSKESIFGGYSNIKDKNIQMYKGNGRFPANLIHDNSEEVRECFPETNRIDKRTSCKSSTGMFFEDSKELSRPQDNGGNASRFFKSIIYQAKSSKSERNKGCEGLEEKPSGCIEARNRESGKGQFEGNKPMGRNNHPTVKPIALMEYLIKMITPKGGVVLDPFAGSGTTLVASKMNGFQYIGIELTEEYIPIIEARLNAVTQQTLNNIQQRTREESVSNN